MGEPPTSTIRRSFDAIADDENRRGEILKKLTKALEGYFGSCSREREVHWDRVTELVGAACRGFYDSLATSYLAVEPPVDPQRLFEISGVLYGGPTIVDFEKAATELKIRRPGHWPPPQMWREDDSLEEVRVFTELSKAMHQDIRLGPHLDGGWLLERVAEGFMHWKPQFERQFAAHVEAAKSESREVRMSESGSTDETKTAPEMTRTSSYVFRRQGRIWELIFAGKRKLVQHVIGLTYIADLLRSPRTEIEALALASRSTEQEIRQVISAGIEVADEDAIRQVQTVLKERQSALAALDDNDWARRGPIVQQIEKLEKYIGDAQRAPRLPRKTGGTVERARVSVTVAIKRGIARIRKEHPELATHLEKTIRTGTSLAYMPEEVLNWEF